MKLQKIIAMFALFALALLAPAGASEAVVAQDRSDVVLVVTSGDEVAISLDLDALRAIGTQEIVTSTIWTDGAHRFTGVPLVDLLKHLELDSSYVIATAINDYSIMMPTPKEGEDSPIVAFEMDGKPMPRRGKGPLWIVYPFDQDAKFRTETIYARSIWQLNRLETIK